jgi:hypothetical protein
MAREKVSRAGNVVRSVGLGVGILVGGLEVATNSGCQTCGPNQGQTQQYIPRAFVCHGVRNQERGAYPHDYEEPGNSNFMVGDTVFYLYHPEGSDRGKKGHRRITFLGNGKVTESGESIISHTRTFVGSGFTVNLPGRYRIETVVDGVPKGAIKIHVGRK